MFDRGQCIDDDDRIYFGQLRIGCSKMFIVPETVIRVCDIHSNPPVGDAQITSPAVRPKDDVEHTAPGAYFQVYRGKGEERG